MGRLEVRLSRLKKDRSGSYRQKRSRYSIAIGMLSKAYADHYDIAILIAGDDDFLDVVTAVKNAGKRVYDSFFINHVSPDLNSFDKHLIFDKERVKQMSSE